MVWLPGAYHVGELAETDEERRIWRHIKNRRADSLLAATWTPKSVDVIAGGQEWTTWFGLWENFLDSGFL